jgi:hypothetical protein
MPRWLASASTSVAYMGRKTVESCRVPGCNRKATTCGVCHKHYQFFRYHERKGRVAYQDLFKEGVMLEPWSTANSPAREILEKVLRRTKRRNPDQCQNKSA